MHPQQTHSLFHARHLSITRTRYFDYAVIKETFEIQIPHASGTAEDRLEGKA